MQGRIGMVELFMFEKIHMHITVIQKESSGSDLREKTGGLNHYYSVL